MCTIKLAIAAYRQQGASPTANPPKHSNSELPLALADPKVKQYFESSGIARKPRGESASAVGAPEPEREREPWSLQDLLGGLPEELRFKILKVAISDPRLLPLHDVAQLVTHSRGLQ
jgi:hypothetical protein